MKNNRNLPKPKMEFLMAPSLSCSDDFALPTTTVPQPKNLLPDVFVPSALLTPPSSRCQSPTQMLEEAYRKVSSMDRAGVSVVSVAPAVIATPPSPPQDPAPFMPLTPAASRAVSPAPISFGFADQSNFDEMLSMLEEHTVWSSRSTSPAWSSRSVFDAPSPATAPVSALASPVMHMHEEEEDEEEEDEDEDVFNEDDDRTDTDESIAAAIRLGETPLPRPRKRLSSAQRDALHFTHPADDMGEPLLIQPPSAAAVVTTTTTVTSSGRKSRRVVPYEDHDMDVDMDDASDDYIPGKSSSSVGRRQKRSSSDGRGRRTSSEDGSSPYTKTTKRKRASQLSKRDSHNVSERMRRHDLKLSFDMLRDAVPGLIDARRAHTGAILKAAIDHIRVLEEEDRQLASEKAKLVALNNKLKRAAARR